MTWCNLHEGLDAWWAVRLEARAAARATRLTRHQPETYGDLSVWDVKFSGDRGARIRGWYLRPAGSVTHRCRWW